MSELGVENNNAQVTSAVTDSLTQFICFVKPFNGGAKCKMFQCRQNCANIICVGLRCRNTKSEVRCQLLLSVFNTISLHCDSDEMTQCDINCMRQMPRVPMQPTVNGQYSRKSLHMQTHSALIRRCGKVLYSHSEQAFNKAQSAVIERFSSGLPPLKKQGLPSAKEAGNTLLSAITRRVKDAAQAVVPRRSCFTY